MLFVLLVSVLVSVGAQSEFDVEACFSEPVATPSHGQLGVIVDEELGTTFIHFAKSWEESESQLESLDLVEPNRRACLKACQLVRECRYVIIHSEVDGEDKPCSHSTAKWEKFRGEVFRTGEVGGQEYNLEYYQKVCKTPAMVERMEARSCEGRLFAGVQQAVMLGHVKHVAILPSQSLGECVTKCLEVDDCVSVMFYYQDGECLLNDYFAYEGEVEKMMIRAEEDDPQLDGLMDFVEVNCEKIGESSNVNDIVSRRRRRKLLAARLALRIQQNKNKKN